MSVQGQDPFFHRNSPESWSESKLNKFKALNSSVLSSDLPCKDDNARFTTVPLKASCKQLWIRYACFCLFKLFFSFFGFSAKVTYAFYAYKKYWRNSQN